MIDSIFSHMAIIISKNESYMKYTEYNMQILIVINTSFKYFVFVFLFNIIAKQFDTQV